MMHHHPTSSGSSSSASVLSVSSSAAASNATAQRDRDRQREREQRRQQAVLAAGSNHQSIIQQQNSNPVQADKSAAAAAPPACRSPPLVLFPVEPVMRVEQEDNFSKEIKSTLGEFGKLMPYLSNSYNYPTDGYNLVGISRNEINRRKVNEILTEMTQQLPQAPITALDDIPVEAADPNHRNVHHTVSSYHKNPMPPSSSALHAPTNTVNTHHLKSSSPSYGQQHNQYKQNTKPAVEPPKPFSLKLSPSSSSASGSSSSSSASESSESEDEADSSGGSVSSKGSDHDKEEGEHNSDDDDGHKRRRNGTGDRLKSEYKKSAESMEVDARVKLKHQQNNHHDEDDEASKWDLESFIKNNQPKNAPKTSGDSVNRELSNAATAKYSGAGGVPSDGKKHSTKFTNNGGPVPAAANHKTTQEAPQAKNRTKMNNNRSRMTRKRTDSSEPSDASYASDGSSGKSSIGGSRPPSRTLPDNRHQDQEMEEGELNDHSNLEFDAAPVIAYEDGKFGSGRSKQTGANAKLKNNDMSILDHRGKQPPESKSKKKAALLAAPPIKFPGDLGQVAMSIKIPKVSNRTHDENSWKDVKRRKDPPPTAAAGKHSSKSEGPTTVNHNLQVPEPKVEAKNRNQLSSKPKNPSPIPANRKSDKYSPHGTKTKELPPATTAVESNFNRKADPQQQSLIVSIELPKLNRVPQVERNGYVDGKKSKDSKKPEAKCQNGKPPTAAAATAAAATASLTAKNPKSAGKGDQVQSTSTKSDEHRNHRHQLAHSPSTLPVSIPMSSQIKLKTSPVVPNQVAAGPVPAATTGQQHRSPLCHNEKEAQSMARTLKRKADSIKSLPHQVLKYIEASLYFIQAGLFMEPKQEKELALQLYRDTLAFVKQTTSKLSKNRQLPASMGNNNEHNPTDLKLLILSYRVQALLNSRLTKLRAREILENKNTLDPLLAEQLKAAVDNAAATITLPMPTVSMIQRQFMLLMHPYLANDLWIKAETMLENNAAAVKPFFQQIDQECGPLHFSSLMEHLIHHTLRAVKLLQDSLPPYDVSAVTVPANASGQAVPPSARQ